MDKKKGDRGTSIKIIPSNNLLNKRNILFLLVALLLVILIVYFLIKAWPIMQERLGDKDEDGIKNYQDKCLNTPLGVTIDEYGCEISKEVIHKESPKFIEEEEEPEEKTDIICRDSDGGKDIWNKGTCKDSKENKDYCKENFGVKLYEFECSNNICDKSDIDCSDYNALCYDGRCIDKNKDTDKDGYPDIDEYDKGTDPNNPNDNPGNMTIQIQSDCNSRCISLGYISGRGPFNSIGYCNSPEVGQYVLGNSGDVCCCMPASTGYYSFQQCLSLQNNHGADFSQRQEDDWTQSSCQVYASPRCNATNIGFDRNCCWWSCYKPISATRTCTDSDGGDKIYIKGTVTGLNPEPYSFTDKCTDNTYLDEFWCAQIPDGYTFGGAIKKCDYGCADGRCKEYINPNTGLDCGSTAVTPTSQADCSLRVGCSGATYCEFRYNRCVCSWIQDCVDSDFEEGYRYLEIYKHKGYCKKGSGTQNWDTCVNGKLREWTCGPTELCESFDVNCVEWFEGGYCEDGICKIHVYPTPHYLTQYRPNGHSSCPATCKKDQPCTVDATKVFSIAAEDSLTECQIALHGIGYPSISGSPNALTFTITGWGQIYIYVTCKNSQGLWDDNHNAWDDNTNVGSIVCNINVVP